LEVALTANDAVGPAADRGSNGATVTSGAANRPPRPSWRRRLRYRFDTAFSRGPTSVIIWLGAIVVIEVLLAATLLAAFRVRINNAHASFLEAFWQTLLQILNTGTILNDNGWPLRVTALIITLSGIFLASALIGIIAAGINRKIEDLRRGRSFVVEEGHTLILGWSPRIFTVIGQLCIANDGNEGDCIVVLAPLEKPDMENEIRARVGSTRGTRIVCRTGDPARLHDLAIADIARARSVAVLGGTDVPGGDAATVKAVLAALLGNPDPSVPIVAELNDPDAARALSNASKGRVHIVRASDVIANATAQACRQSGLSGVCQELLGFDGAAIYFEPAPELEGHTFGDALLAYETSSVIGIRTPDGTTHVNPPVETTFGAGDEVIAVSRDEDTVVFTGLRDTSVPNVSRDRRRWETQQRILVVGWNQLGSAVLRELDTFVPKGSSADVLVDEHLVPIAGIEAIELGRIAVQFLPCGADMEQLGVQLGPGQPPYDHVIIFGYRNLPTIDEADARTFLTLLLLHEARENNRAGRIVAEILDTRDLELAQATGANDFIVSDALSSCMIAQLTENPEVDAVFADLFDAAGSAVGLKPATWYVPHEGPVPFGDVVAAARERGDAAIGYRLGGDAASPVLRMNPPKTERVTLGEQDQIVVVGPPE
jgi:ion channel POLLUX/CASTOR